LRWAITLNQTIGVEGNNVVRHVYTAAAVGNHLGITRQAVNQRVERGTLLKPSIMIHGADGAFYAWGWSQEQLDKMIRAEGKDG